MAFNNHPGSTKSFDYVRAHNEAVNRLDFVPHRDEISTEYAAGDVQEVTQHDGSVLRLRKLAPDYDPNDLIGAMNSIQQRHAAGEILTGLLYVDPSPQDLHALLDTANTPLNAMSDAELVPGAAALEKINASLR